MIATCCEKGYERSNVTYTAIFHTDVLLGLEREQSLFEQLRVQVQSDREHILANLHGFEKQLNELLQHRGRLSSLLGSVKGYDVEQLTFALQSLQDEFAPPPTKRARSNDG